MPYYDMPAIVFLHMETTDLSAYCHITQLSAKCGNAEFNVYVKANRTVCRWAEQLTGISWNGRDLWVKNRRVGAQDLCDVMSQFISFLWSCSNGNGGHGVILAAHNCRCYHTRVLRRAAGCVGQWGDLEAVVRGYVDTLPLMRQQLPDLNSHKLHALVWTILGIEVTTHNALADVRYLDQLIDRLQLSDSDIADLATD